LKGKLKNRKMKKDELFQHVEKRAAELTEQHDRKVIPLVFGTEEEPVIGYLKEISRVAKIRILDSALTGGMTACESLVDDCLIQEADYKKILEEDVYYLGVVNEINLMIKTAGNKFKKK
jgi:hypothetical protein